MTPEQEGTPPWCALRNHTMHSLIKNNFDAACGLGAKEEFDESQFAELIDTTKDEPHKTILQSICKTRRKGQQVKGLLKRSAYKQEKTELYALVNLGFVDAREIYSGRKSSTRFFSPKYSPPKATRDEQIKARLVEVLFTAGNDGVASSKLPETFIKEQKHLVNDLVETGCISCCLFDTLGGPPKKVYYHNTFKPQVLSLEDQRLSRLILALRNVENTGLTTTNLPSVFRGKQKNILQLGIDLGEIVVVKTKSSKAVVTTYYHRDFAPQQKETV